MARPTVPRFLRLTPFGEGEDPDAAPGAFKGPCAARPWSLRRARQNLVGIYLFGLVFLIFPLVDLLTTGGLAERVAGVILVGVIAGMYLVTAWVSDASLWGRWSYLGSFLVVLVSSAFLWGWAFANYGVYVAIMMATLIPWRQARAAISLWGLVLGLVGLISQTWTPIYIAALGVGVALATGGGLESGRMSFRLNRAEQRVSVLAVAAERERIGRDLHDILGHSLTAIAIKSALAVKLVDQNPSAAKQQLAEIEEVSRQALADVRSTTSGFREIRLATEIASARSILQAAGIQARVPSAIEPMSDELSELYGYLVREGVTNVVRHSDATTCTIALGRGQLSVADDGKGFDQAGAGSGLSGLAERVRARGGRFEVAAQPGRGTVIRAVLEPSDDAEPDPAGQVLTR